MTDEGISQDIMERHFEHSKEELQKYIDSLDPIVREALNLYIMWLNQPNQRGEFELDTAYEFDHFFSWSVEHDGGISWDRHYETVVHNDIRFPTGRFIHMSAGTADEGGAAQLFILTDADGGITQITQEFDTMYSLVYFDSHSTEVEASRNIVPFAWTPQEDPGDSSQS